MTWFKVDDSVPDHPKFLTLEEQPRVHGNAVTLWLFAGCWCSKHLTDGVIPKAKVRRLVPWRTARAEKALVAAGLWHDEGNAYRFHDFHDWQPTRESVLCSRERARERMRKVRGTFGNPDPTRPDLNRYPSPVIDQVETPGEDRVRGVEPHEPESLGELLEQSIAQYRRGKDG